MGILNVTPDSFSDGGRYVDATAAAGRARALVAAGADLVDIGAESSRPGSEPVSAADELARLEPILEDLAADGGLGVPISIDTYKPEVARRALESGVDVINDISGGSEEMLAVAREFDAPLIAMHMQGSPRTMQSQPRYDDVVSEVTDYLAERKAAADQASVQVILDPGIGFGKSLEHNLALLTGLARVAQIGAPVLVGTSRKSFLGTLSGRPVDERVDESVASGLVARRNGAQLLRVHDVAAHRAALDVIERLEQTATDTGEGAGQQVWVFARDLSLQTRIGTTAAEREHPQRLIVDLEARLQGSAPIRDHDVATTLDYVALELLAREVCDASDFHLLETLAAAIAERALERFSIDEVLVRIQKPAVGQMRHGGDFGVELRRSRG